jgi:hypothetical protein
MHEAMSARRRPHGVFRRRGQRAQDPRSKRWKIIEHRIPHRFDIHPVIPMPEPVADAADIAPRQAGTQPLCIISKPYRCLADKQKLALDCGDRLWIFPEGLQIRVAHELCDHVDTFEDVSQ